MVSFMPCDPGFFDTKTKKFEPIPDPFDAKLLPMS